MATQWQTNPDQVNQAGKKYRSTEKYRQQVRHNSYMRLYGISLEDYNKKLEAQSFVCKICHCPETYIGLGGNVKTLAVDHCHDTGEVRGLLCDRCNHILGRAKDSATLLENAAKYLRGYQ